jgi:hypothetical protein
LDQFKALATMNPDVEDCEPVLPKQKRNPVVYGAAETQLIPSFAGDFRALIKQTFSDQSWNCSAPQIISGTRTVYASCTGCKENCTFKMKCTLQRHSDEQDLLGHGTFGAHGSGMSKLRASAQTRSLARELASSSDLPPCNLRRDYLEAHPADGLLLPTEKDISRHRYISKKVARDLAPGQSPAEMQALIATMGRSAEQSASALWVPADHCVINEMETNIPFTSDYLLQSFIGFAAKSEVDPKFVIDFTHDQCREGFKVGNISALGSHFDDSHGQWAETILPIMYLLCNEETKVSNAVLLDAAHGVLKALYDYDIFVSASYIYSDGGCGIPVYKDRFRNAKLRRCLEHIKRNVLKKVKGGVGSQICQWVQITAFVLSPFTFDLIWHVLLDKLASGTEQTKMARQYLLDAHILVSDGGLFTADWRSSISDIERGFSTFSSNALESHWRVLDLLHSRTQGRESAAAVFSEFRKSFLVWARDRKLQKVQPTPITPTPRLLRGNGFHQPKGFLYDKKFDRFTVSSLNENSSKDYFMLRVLPADLKVEQLFKDILVIPKVPKKTWEDEGAAMLQFAKLQFACTSDDAKAAFPKLEDCFSWKQFRELYSQYTLVGRRVDNSICDTHPDFAIKGESEHAYFASQLFNAINFGPLGGAQALANSKEAHRQNAAKALASRRAVKRTAAEELLATPPRKHRAAAPASPPAEIPAPSALSVPAEASHEVCCDKCGLWSTVSLEDCNKYAVEGAIFHCSFVAKICRQKRR